MKKVFGRRPSASMVVALTALVVAMSGTAVAAGVTMYNGNKIIKKHSLSGNRLTYKSVTGYAIKLSKLGTVPTAKYANAANDANFASNAGNADKLAGQSASAYLPANVLQKSGSVTLTAPSTTGDSTTQTLLTPGPFTVTGKCTNDGSSGTIAEVDGSSSVANSAIGDTEVPTAGTSQDMNEAGPSPSFDAEQTMWDWGSTLLTPAGQGYTLIGDNIANPGGNTGTCQFDLEALSLS